MSREWMAGVFSDLAGHVDKLFRRIQMGHVTGFIAELEELDTMIPQVLTEKHTEADETPHDCQHCDFWNTAGDQAVCTGYDSPHQYIQTGAGWTCEQWRPKIRRSQNAVCNRD